MSPKSGQQFVEQNTIDCTDSDQLQHQKTQRQFKVSKKECILLRNNKDHWDKKFGSRGIELLPPESFIVDNSMYLKKGSKLDFACGDGRNAIYFAKLGYSVSGVDFSSVALQRLKSFADKNSLSIQLHETDLESQESFLDLGSFDNVIVSHFIPPKIFWKQIDQLLKPLGSFIFCTFNIKQHLSEGFPLEYCVGPSEFKSVPGLGLIKYETFIEGDRHLDGYVFRRL